MQRTTNCSVKWLRAGEREGGEGGDKIDLCRKADILLHKIPLSAAMDDRVVVVVVVVVAAVL